MVSPLTFNLFPLHLPTSDVALGFVLVCTLTLTDRPLMYFVFLGTGLCRLTFFTPVITHHELVTC
jgi:hypothetical protein